MLTWVFRRLERDARSIHDEPLSARSRVVLESIRSGRVSRSPRPGRARPPVTDSPRFGVALGVVVRALFRQVEVRVTRLLGDVDCVVGDARLVARRVSRYGLEAFPRNQGHATGGCPVQRDRGRRHRLGSRMMNAFFVRKTVEADFGNSEL